MIRKAGYVFIAYLTNGAQPLFGRPIAEKLIELG